MKVTLEILQWSRRNQRWEILQTKKVEAKETPKYYIIDGGRYRKDTGMPAKKQEFSPYSYRVKK
jgi:hypothetical protein